MDIYYETSYQHPSRGAATYRTKSLTDMHKSLRERFGGTTMKCDPSKPWPFGVFAEVIAQDPSPKQVAAMEKRWAREAATHGHGILYYNDSECHGCAQLRGRDGEFANWVHKHVNLRRS